MLSKPTSSTPVNTATHVSAAAILRLIPAIVALLAVATTAPAAPPPTAGRDSDSEFLRSIQLAPFVVNGNRLTISIHARSASDRRYAEKFAEEVIRVADATLENSAGSGLVIVGAKGEPHPVFIFEKFQAMARAGRLNPDVAASAGPLDKMIRDWEFRANVDGDSTAELGLDFDTIVRAMPLPLEGAGSRLYQLAWAENFDAERVEQKLQSLTPADLTADRLSTYDWVFYLPPRDAFNQVLKAAVPAIMEKEKIGFFKRTLWRGALLAFKPAIRKAVEGLRKGMLFMTVLRARSGDSMDDIMALTGAYVRVLMPDFKFNGGTTHQRALEAIEAQKLANAEYARDPFVSPERLANFEAAAYARFEGEYAERQETTHRFARHADGFTWQYLDRQPSAFHPASDRLFVHDDGHMTIEFLVDDAGNVTGVEERWKRFRKTIPRQGTDARK